MTERIGRYDLLKTLVEGDRGKLYLAKSSGFGGFARHVVVKTFEKLPGAAEGPFIEETLDLGRLHHQHITPVLDVGRDGERFYVALDFVHGRSAREVWQQTFTIGALLPLDFALTVVVAIASGLHHAHTRRRTDGSPLGLVHGHVSLSNILIGFDGCVQLIGFAGASARGLRASETQLGFSKDQLAYLAPEQARRQGLDARSDVFALGVILYELTTMRRAFRDDSDRLTIERVKIGSYVKPRSISPDFPVELERVITRALQIDPAARYPDVETMRRELTAVGHHLDLVLGDAAVVEVMAQLFEDSTVDPWTNAKADTASDALPTGPTHAVRRPLRAATETVDALAIELEIPVEEANTVEAALARMGTVTNPDAARFVEERHATNPEPSVAPDNFDTRSTTPVAAFDATRSTDPVRVLEAVRATPVAVKDAARASDHAADAAAAAAAIASVPDDTDGVPVLRAPPASPSAAGLPKPAVATAVPPAPRRRLDYRIVAFAAMLVTIGVTSVLTLRMCGSDDSPRALDAGTASMSAPPDAVIARSIDAAPVATIDASSADVADASSTIQLRITSTPPNATVLLDGRRLGKTPFEGAVDRSAGKHVMKVRLTGYTTAKLDLELTGDVTQEVVLVRKSTDATDAGDGPRWPDRDLSD